MRSVAPYMGAWIETPKEFETKKEFNCRSLHGGRGLKLVQAGCDTWL